MSVTFDAKELARRKEESKKWKPIETINLYLSLIWAFGVSLFLAYLFDWSSIVTLVAIIPLWLIFNVIGTIQIEEDKNKQLLADAAKKYLEENKVE